MIILDETLEHILAMADLITKISANAIEWAEEYNEANPGLALDIWRRVAYDRACNLFDGNDDCILNCDDCFPTDFEFDVFISSYVYAVFAYLQQHTVIQQ